MSRDESVLHDASTACALQDATGMRYTICLARVRMLRELAPIPILHAGLPVTAHVGPPRYQNALDNFMERVASLPDLNDDQVRCVTCLRDLLPVRKCSCL